MLCGFVVTRWALGSAAPRLDPRMLISLSGLVLVFAAVWQTYAFLGLPGLLRELVDWGNFISPVFLGLVACAFLWFQGIQLGRSALPQENLERAFYGGILAIGLLFTVNQLRPLIATAEALSAALAFFATGLASLALVSVENARRAAEGLAGSWPALNRYWLGTVASVIGSILLAGLLLASILSPQTFDQLANTINLIVDAVTIVFIVLAGSLAFLLAWLLEPVFRYLAEAIRQINFRLPTPPNLQEASKQTLDFFARFRPSTPPVLRDSLIDALALDHGTLQRRIKFLSHGTRQKIGLIVAMQHDPALLLLDEPSNGLDPLVQHALREILRGFAERGRSVLSVFGPEQFDWHRLLGLLAGLFLLQMSFYSLTLLFSSFGRESGRVATLGVLAAIVSFLDNVIASLWSKAAFMKPYSLHSYYDPRTILVDGRIPASSVMVLCIFALVAIAGAFARFLTRDLP